MTEALLTGYRSAIGNSPIIPTGRAFDELLCALVVDKARYELRYELNNRPDWVRIPLTGILTLMQLTSFGASFARLVHIPLGRRAN